MTRKALVRRIAEVLFNEPATRRGAGAGPTRRAARILAGVLCCSSVKDHSGYSPSYRQSGSDRRAPNQNSQQRCYTSHGSGAPDDASFRSAALDQEIALIEIGKPLSAERRAASARAKERSPS
jgi:hypothetical protein